MTIWQSIGNAFSRGWKNGNIAKGFTIAGTTAMGIGMTGAMIHDMKHNNSCSSIFGNCWGGFGCNSFGNFNMFNQAGSNMFNFDTYNNFGSYNQSNTQDAYMAGLNAYQQALLQAQRKT